MCTEIKNPKEKCKIIYNKEIATGIYELLFDSMIIANATKPGQFVNLYVQSEALLLPRPISICEVDRQLGVVKLIYAVVGKGTELVSTYESGQEIEILGPLGNGFPLEEAPKHILVGGGVGTPPMLELAKNLEGEKYIFLGFRTEPYLIKELSAFGQVFVATEDGSFGHKGNVIELMNKVNAEGDYVYSCGPTPMLKAVVEWADKKGVPAYISLEERMGCGFGACVGCAQKVVADNEEGYRYKKVCKDGPVFTSKEVLL